MAVAMGAIRGIFRIITGNFPHHGEQTLHVVTILDVLEPQGLRG